MFAGHGRHAVDQPKGTPSLIVTGAFDGVVPSLAEEMHQRIAVTAFLNQHDQQGERA